MHQSHPRNELIAKVFYDTGFIEKWGTGTTKMLTLCKEHRLPEPEFSEYSGGFSIQFKFKASLGAISLAIRTKSPLSSRQSDILQIIGKYGKAKMQYILSELKDPPTSRMVLKDLNHLKELGLIELEGSTKAALWTIKPKNAP
ncbi:MAG: hypothetical protein HY559_01275 [Gammaproteobacteria bacterium]|nr:hypothetical protein [Gammaproteobacteria bacterium]